MLCEVVTQAVKEAGDFALARVGNFGEVRKKSPKDFLTDVDEEAGAKVTDYQGRPHHLESKTIVSANPVLHPQILELVNVGRG